MTTKCRQQHMFKYSSGSYLGVAFLSHKNAVVPLSYKQRRQLIHQSVALQAKKSVAREQIVPPCHSHESVYSRNCSHSQQG